MRSAGPSSFPRSSMTMAARPVVPGGIAARADFVGAAFGEAVRARGRGRTRGTGGRRGGRGRSRRRWTGLQVEGDRESDREDDEENRRRRNASPAARQGRGRAVGTLRRPCARPRPNHFEPALEDLVLFLRLAREDDHALVRRETLAAERLPRGRDVAADRHVQRPAFFGRNAALDDRHADRRLAHGLRLGAVAEGGRENLRRSGRRVVHQDDDPALPGRPPRWLRAACWWPCGTPRWRPGPSPGRARRREWPRPGSPPMDPRRSRITAEMPRREASSSSFFDGRRRGRA